MYKLNPDQCKYSKAIYVLNQPDITDLKIKLQKIFFMMKIYKIFYLTSLPIPCKYCSLFSCWLVCSINYINSKNRVVLRRQVLVYLSKCILCSKLRKLLRCVNCKVMEVTRKLYEAANSFHFFRSTIRSALECIAVLCFFGAVCKTMSDLYQDFVSTSGVFKQNFKDYIQTDTNACHACGKRKSIVLLACSFFAVRPTVVSSLKLRIRISFICFKFYLLMP